MVDVSDINAKTSVAQAQHKARQFVAEFKMLKSLQRPRVQLLSGVKQGGSKGEELARAANDAVMRRFVHPFPRNAFIYELGSTFGGIQEVEDAVPTIDWPEPEDAVAIDSVDDLFDIQWSQRPTFDGKVWLPNHAAIVVPVTDPFILEGGETFSFTFQVFREESKGTTYEKYVDVYVSVEESAKLQMPIINVFSFDIKAGVKTGEKQADQEIVRKSTRIGRQISRTWVMERIGRNCLIYAPFMASAFGDIWVQLGRRIQPKMEEGGDAVSFFSGVHMNGNNDDEDSVYSTASYYLKKMIDKAALDAAKHAAIMR